MENECLTEKMVDLQEDVIQLKNQLYAENIIDEDDIEQLGLR